MGGLVTGPEDVDAAWLTAALRSSGALGDAAVVSYTAEPIGTGQVGHNVRFTLDYDRDAPGAPRSVVAKFPSPDETSRATGVAIGNYDKEARFYAELADLVEIRIPHCHLVLHDEEAHLSTLLFADLAPAEQGDQIRGCSPEEAGLAMDELAALHAPLWEDGRLDAIAWLGRPSSESGEVIQAFYGGLWPGFLERYDGRLSPEVRDLGARFGAHLADWAGRRIHGPHTVVHGDFRLDNLLFGPASDGTPSVTTVDWQTVSIGIGTDDVAYFLGAGLLPDDRRTHERDLVARYYEGLLARGVRDYSWETCWDDYRRFSLSGLQMAVIASMIVRADPRGDEMFLAMAERHTAQALDHGVDALLA